MASDAPLDILKSIPLFAPHLDALTCTPLSGGQLNKAFRVVSPAGDHVVRVGRRGVPLDRRYRERANILTAAAQDLAPAVPFADEARGILVMSYLSGTLAAGVFADRTRLDRVAAAYEALHAGQAFEGTFSPFRRLAYFVERCADLPLPEVPDRAALTAALGRVEALLSEDAPPAAPCHNDPNPHNLVDTPDGIRLIDWEDSAMADPDWEIGAFPVLSRLTADEEAYFFQRCYGSAAGPRAHRARLFQCIQRGIHAFQALHRTTDQDVDTAHWRAQAVDKFDDLRRRLEVLAAPTPPAAKQDRPTIFVSIASYRDPDCQNTVQDLFAKAAHPDRVFVGICWQFVPGDDDDCFALPAPRPDQVRVLDFHAKRSRGACWARYQVQSLWRGEDFVFQIDSHMRFVEGWDDRLLAMHDACPSDKAVLSTYPLGFVPPDDFKPPAVVRIHAKAFDKNGILTFGSEAKALDKAPREVQRTPFIAAGMLFGPAPALITEVPYDPALYFQGEEITLAARLFTHGWDVYAPNDAIAWHDYRKHPTRPRHWQDGTDWTSLNEASFARVRHLFGMQLSTDPRITRDLDRFGLGSARTLAEYEAFAGVEFASRLVDGKAATTDSQTPDAKEQVSARADMFTQIWRQNAWKVEETRSGRYATHGVTTALRSALPGVLKDLGVETLADAGCGDMHWMAEVSKDLRFTFGFDIVPDAVEDLASRFADRPNHFFRRADIVIDPLPACDAILCRDVLSHLPQAHGIKALQRFKDSGSTYLIATTHLGCTLNPWILVGGWYPIALTAPPFNLPPPLHVIDEQIGPWTKALGVWRLADLPDWPA